MTERSAGFWGRAGAVLLAMVLAAQSGLGGQELSLPLGTQAPAAGLQDLDGNPVQLLDYVEAGKPTLIEFWASWCENCEALQPQLDRIHEVWGSRVNIVAVAVAVSQSQRRVKRHVEDHGIEYPYLWDAEGEAVKAYEIPGTSIVVILNGEGKVVYTGSGRGQDLVGEVQELVGG
ncbi:MAG: redoxin domain-containing protein [Gemmatimonadetes bacterium]|nr:redoxin domain-containing protein [Gemmatimonadota bacterium]NNM06066.1 redoxin domain-containing protein [Gemmatimonadota bacterium]